MARSAARVLITSMVTTLTAAAIVTVPLVAQQCTTVRVSTAAGGGIAGGNSSHPTVSADGRFVVFDSDASNLTGAMYPYSQVIVYRLDRQTGLASAISIPSNSPNYLPASRRPSISSSADTIAYESDGAEVYNDSNSLTDIYVYTTAARYRVSIATSGAQSNAPSFNPAVSRDGQFVVFESTASNLSAGDSLGFSDIFLRDLNALTTERVSLNTLRQEANANCYRGSVSADGRYASWDSAASNLVPNDTNTCSDVFLRDRQLGFVERISVDFAGVQGDGPSDQCRMSDDARYFAFRSAATNLVSGDANNVADIFVRDRLNSTTERVTVSTTGFEANSASDEPTISRDGRYVAFRSAATNLVPGDTNGVLDVYVHDRVTGLTRRASYGEAGMQPTFDCGAPAISDGARWVAFDTQSSLDSADPYNLTDVFVHGFTQSSALPLTTNSWGEPNYPLSSDPTISDDGRYVTLTADAGAFGGPSSSYPAHVWIVDRQTNTAQIASQSSGGAVSNVGGFAPRLSRNGRFVAFISEGTNLVPGDGNFRDDAFIHDRITGTTALVSVASDGTQANSNSLLCVVSDDGRWAAFVTDASNLVPGDYTGYMDVFLRDRRSGTTIRLSQGMNGGDSNGQSFGPSISADGRYIAFYSYSPNLVLGDTNGAADVFVYDSALSTLTLVSCDSAGAQGNGYSYTPALSSDGRYVVFGSDATNLAANDQNGPVADAFAKDLVTGVVELVSLTSAGGAAGNHCYPHSISADGRFVVFSTAANYIVPGDSNGQDDVFVRDRIAGVTRLVSATPGGTTTTSFSRGGSISGDGRYVAFESPAFELVEPPLLQYSARVFVHDTLLAGPMGYCRAKTNSQGCTPAISFTGSPSMSMASPFMVVASNVLNQKSGLLFYGTSAAATPFQGAVRCVATPITRTAVQPSGGAIGIEDCSGSYAFDMNARIQSGVDPALNPCVTVHCQWWYRDPGDPAGFGTGLTDGLRFVIDP